MGNNDTVRKKGIRIGRNESVLDAIRNGIPHWIHETREDPSSVSGIIYLPVCHCSECGYTASFEKPFCPHCGVKMKKF
ncbi:MAG: hypothetical protein IJ120_10260 [Solobacterium sp.]|nr:hypothetical protein [Solobacterium sp.]